MLESILVKALSSTPDARHSGCKELADELEDWLGKAGLLHSDTRMGDFLRDLYPEEAKEMPAPGPMVSTSVRTVAGMARPVDEGAGSFLGAGDVPTGGFGSIDAGPRQTPGAHSQSQEARAAAPTVARPAEGWERGSPSGRRTPGFLSSGWSWKPFLIGVAATLLAGVGGWFLVGQFRDKEVYARAGMLMSKGENVTALEVLHTRLKGDPGNFGLREMAVQAASAEVDRRAKIDPEDGLDWLETQLEERPYLEPLRKRIPVLVMRVEFGELKYGRFDKLWELLRQYPDDADAPYVAAELVGKNHVPEASLPFFEEAIRRGHVAGPEVWDDCREALEKNTPDEDIVRDAITLCRSHFPAEIEKWSEVSLKSGGTFSWLNAILLRTQSDDPAVVGDAFLQAVLRFGSGRHQAGDAEILLAEPDSTRGERARDVFQEISISWAMGTAPVDSAKTVLPLLEKRWPEAMPSSTPPP